MNSIAIGKRLRPGLTAIVFASLVLICVGIWFLSADARRQISDLATADTDSTQWSLAQIEVEFLALQLSIQSLNQNSLNDFRTAFDIFYSRIDTFMHSPPNAQVRALNEVRPALARIGSFLDEGAKLADGTDAALVAAQPQLRNLASAVADDVRFIALSGIRIDAERTDQNRSDFANALFDLTALAAFLFSVLLVTVLALLRSIAIARRRDEAANLGQSRLRAIASASQDGILVSDRTGRILDFSGGAEKIFGFRKEEVIGARMFGLVEPEEIESDIEESPEPVDQAATETAGLVQIEAQDKDGRVFPVEVAISSAQSADGDIFVSFIRDISDRVEAENALIEARDRALAGEKAKANFLAMMSHEMRTPLNGILGTLQLFQDTGLDARQKDFVRVMGTSGKMLLRHVNSVLDIVRADAGKLEAAKLAFSPMSVLENAIASQLAAAEARGNQLSLSETSEPVGEVLGDDALLMQILINLLGNAIKFTRDGSITVELEHLRSEEMFEVRVADTGLGIAEEDQQRIFDDFVTLDTSFSRDVDGTGLGLGIVKRLVRAMGGEIGLESELNVGSVFWVRLPTRSGEIAQTQSPKRINLVDEPRARVHSVLVVEDNQINRMVAREMLVQMGCRVREAANGAEAVEIAQLEAFDLILMDISMPEMDGLTATRKIREGEGPNRSSPIVALTAHALPEDIQRFRSSGMDDVLVKPVERALLAQVLGLSTTAKNPEEPELTSVLGKEKARDLADKVHMELVTTLQKLADGKDQDPKAIADTLHNLAGSAAVAGLSQIHRKLSDAETAARNGSLGIQRSIVEDVMSNLQTKVPEDTRKSA